MRKKKSTGRKRSKQIIKIKFLRHLSVTFLAIGIMGIFAVITMYAKPLNPIKETLRDFSFTDIYYEILDEGIERDTSRVITIVDLTKLTRRGDIAQAIADIESCKPKVLGVDCCFDNEGDDFEGNDSLMRVVEKYNNIVFAEKMLDWGGDSVGWTKAIHSFFCDYVNVKEGTVNIPRGLYDRMKRKVPLFEKYQGRLVPSFVTQIANAYAGRNILRGRTADLNINFSPTFFRVLQPADIKKHPEWIEDQVVLFGAMYEDADMHWTPIGRIAGVELLAYGTQSLILSKEIKYLPTVPFCFLTVVIILLVQILQTAYLRNTSQSKRMIVRYVVGSAYFLDVLTFLFLSVFIGVSFMVFKLFNVSFNMAWAVAVIAFLGTSRSLYKSIKKYLSARYNKKSNDTKSIES